MVIADTGFWLALANRRDSDHHHAVASLEKLREPLITTWFAATETCHLLSARLGSHAQQTFLRSFANGAFSMFDLTPEHIPYMTNLMQKYEDLSMDLTDASLVVLAEHLVHGRILSTDQRDFGTDRWKQHKPFENLSPR